MPKNFVGESFSVSLISGIEKFWIRGGREYRDFPSKIFYLTVPKIFVGELFCAVSKFTVGKKFMDKRGGGGGGGGVSRFSVENFLSHSAENFRRGILHCCINFGYRKGLDKRGGGPQDFPSKIFCLTVPKNFVQEPFSVSLTRVSKTVKDKS